MKQTYLNSFLQVEEITATTIFELDSSASGYTVQVTPTGGTTSIQASNDGENWEAWANGSVSATVIEPFYPVRYIKVLIETSTKVNVAIRGC